MRQFLFKGMPWNVEETIVENLPGQGVWAYGDLKQRFGMDGGEIAVITVKGYNGKEDREIRVIPATVCQGTEEFDKARERVYENDVVETGLLDKTGENMIGLVVWESGMFVVNFEDGGSEELCSSGIQKVLYSIFDRAVVMKC